MKAVFFFHGQDIPALIPYIPDVPHDVFDQMDSKTTYFAIFNVILQSRFLGFKRIERLAVILYADIQDTLYGLDHANRISKWLAKKRKKAICCNRILITWG